ncbi:MAG TPA: hypothetical protein VEI04_04405 [Syntrophobacteria bacterium]|nr:hypothetical protein [Syntrophobacteria bacterium]
MSGFDRAGGEVFVVESGEMGKKSEVKDAFIFKDGKFRSTNCDRYGFGDGAYTSTMMGDAITFAADTRSESSGTMHWEGMVQGDKVDVRYTWMDTQVVQTQPDAEGVLGQVYLRMGRARRRGDPRRHHGLPPP